MGASPSTATSKPKRRASRCSASCRRCSASKEPTLQAAYDSPRQSPLMPAVVALDVPLDKRLAILEHPDDYPGVHVVC